MLNGPVEVLRGTPLKALHDLSSKDASFADVDFVASLMACTSQDDVDLGIRLAANVYYGERDTSREVALTNFYNIVLTYAKENDFTPAKTSALLSTAEAVIAGFFEEGKSRSKQTFCASVITALAPHCTRREVTVKAMKQIQEEVEVTATPLEVQNPAKKGAKGNQAAATEVKQEKRIITKTVECVKPLVIPPVFNAQDVHRISTFLGNTLFDHQCLYSLMLSGTHRTVSHTAFVQRVEYPALTRPLCGAMAPPALQLYKNIRAKVSRESAARIRGSLRESSDMARILFIEEVERDTLLAREAQRREEDERNALVADDVRHVLRTVKRLRMKSVGDDMGASGLTKGARPPTNGGPTTPTVVTTPEDAALMAKLEKIEMQINTYVASLAAPTKK
eukprot:PhF_6_TR5620/c0_g1_i2/m.8153